MSLLAVLPVKNLEESKSRLSPLLSREERIKFTLNLLRKIVMTLKTSRCVKEILVISKDSRVQTVSGEEGVLFLTEEGQGLNRALEQATGWSISLGYTANLILPLDIPLLTKDDVDAIVEMGERAPRSVVIAPDLERKGTNALFVKPPGLLRYQFEGQSFIRHLKQVKDKNIPNRIYISHRVGFDVDSPSEFCSMAGSALEELFVGRGH